jgi:hypothetical protein
MTQENVEFVRGAFGVLTIPGNPETMIAASQPDVEMQLVGVGREPVYYTGASGIREFFDDVGRDLGDLPLRGHRAP